MKSLPFLLAIAITVGCGGTPKEGTTPSGGGGGSAKPSAAGDVSIELPPSQLDGMVFLPEALGRPGMPLYMPKNKRLTIAQQQKIFGRTKNLVEKQAQAAVLATMLYEASKTKTGDDQKKLIEDARQVLRTVDAAAKDKVDPITLRLLGSYEIQLEDWAAAEQAWHRLIAKSAKDPDLHEHKAWWIYTMLRQHKHAEALAAAKAETPSAKQPLLAYAIAWAKWCGGDSAGAWQAIALAAEGWGTNANRDALERDLFLFASRSNVPYGDAKAELFKIFNATQPAQKYELLAKLGQSAYQFAGRWADAVTAIDEALKAAGSTVPAEDKVRLRYFTAEFLVPQDQPDATARNAKAALAAMPGCAKCTAEEKQGIVQRIYGIARILHLMYATANDIRYYQPAHDLYEATIPLIQDNAMRTQATSDKTVLEKTLKNTKVGTGTHEKQAMNVLLGRHNQEILACYEHGLASNPKLGGQLTLELESDATGAIKGASSEPKAGEADLAAVAGCAIAHAKQWKLPKRGMAGSTRIKLVYNLAPKK